VKSQASLDTPFCGLSPKSILGLAKLHFYAGNCAKLLAQRNRQSRQNPLLTGQLHQ